MGGGALMTPMLVLLFGVTPSSAIASDLVAALFMKPAGRGDPLASRHGQQGSREVPLPRLGARGVPRHVSRCTSRPERQPRRSASRSCSGVALIIGRWRHVRARRHPSRQKPSGPDHVPVAASHIAIGVFGGFMVGLTSRGRGFADPRAPGLALPERCAATSSSAPTSPSRSRSRSRQPSARWSSDTSTSPSRVRSSSAACRWSRRDPCSRLARSNGSCCAASSRAWRCLAASSTWGCRFPSLGVAAVAIFAVVLLVTVRNRRVERLAASGLDETLLAPATSSELSTRGGRGCRRASAIPARPTP